MTVSHLKLDNFAQVMNMIVLQPNIFKAWDSLADIQGQPAEIIEPYCRRSVFLMPYSTQARDRLGDILWQQKKFDEALVFLRQAVVLDPANSSAWSNLSVTFFDIKRFNESMCCNHRAMVMMPGYVSLLANHGLLLQMCGRFHEAMGIYKYAIVRQPDMASLYADWGANHASLGRMEDAIIVGIRSVWIDPVFVAAHTKLADSLLSVGMLEEGFYEREWQWQDPEIIAGVSQFSVPLWQGENGHGRRLLIHCEHGGFGDFIQFCRYTALASAKGWRVFFEVDLFLSRLFSKLDGVEKVFYSGSKLPEFDAHSPIMRLPFVCGTRWETIPAIVDFHIASSDIAKWQRRLSSVSAGKAKVGLVWAGNSFSSSSFQPWMVAMNQRRSISPELLAPLFLCDNICFVNLQKEKDGSIASANLLLVDFMDDVLDFYDTSALISALDLVISVDTAVIHLAASLGKEVWMLDRFDACWRWPRGWDTSPWYPTLRIFRQTRLGDWKDVIENVRENLQGKFAASTMQSSEQYFAVCRDLQRRGQRDEALAFYKVAIVVSPVFHLDCFNFVLLLRSHENLVEQAISWGMRNIRLNPDDQDSHSIVGDMLVRQFRWAEAIPYLCMAIVINPENHMHYNILSEAFVGVCDLDKAFLCLHYYINIIPDDVRMLNKLGYICFSMHRLDETESFAREAIRRASDIAEPHVTLALSLLARGKFEEGWREYEWRWMLSSMSLEWWNERAPRWKGERGNGGILALRGEQGFGDVIQFCRYAPLISKLGWRVVLQTRPVLVPLLRTLKDVELVVADREELPNFDVYCPLMSLPLVFNTVLDNIPVEIPYLYAETVRAASWQERISRLSGQKLKIGLVWGGRLSSASATDIAMDWRRSIRPELFHPLFNCKNVVFFSLQKGGSEMPQDLPVIDFMGEIESFADSAALIANLDLVISVDTAVIHLAAAMGKTVWLLNRYDSCWRWLSGKEDSPWYPTLRIFWQREPGDWGEVIERVKLGIEAFVELHGIEFFAQGESLMSQGQLEEACSFYYKSIIVEPDFSRSYLNQGICLLNFSREAETARLWQKYVRLHPYDANARVNLGGIWTHLGQLSLAKNSNMIGIILDPVNPVALFNLGGIARIEIKFTECYNNFYRIVVINPDNAEARLNLGSAFDNIEKNNDGIKEYKISLIIEPSYISAYLNIASSLYLSGNMEDAADQNRRVIILDHQRALAHKNMGILNSGMVKFDDAILCFRKALILEPSEGEASVFLGNSLQAAGRFAEGEAALRKGIAVSPEFVLGHVMLSSVLLAQGKYQEGWQEWEWRDDKSSANDPEQEMRGRGVPLTRWLGSSGEGKKLLIHSWGVGIGDCLQFCRYIPLLARQGWRIWLEVRPDLVRLLEKFDGIEKIVPWGADLPGFDANCPIMSLPAVFNTSIENIPAMPRLTVNYGDFKKWQAKLSAEIGENDSAIPKIGLVWAGNSFPSHKPNATVVLMNRQRSIRPELLAPLFASNGKCFVSLQKEQNIVPADFPIIDFMSDADDFLDTAAIIANLDLVISVDTAVAHLAAAMGKKVWLLNRFSSCWRWMPDREYSLWYPSLRVFRQTKIGDWEGVIARVKQALDDFSG